MNDHDNGMMHIPEASVRATYLNNTEQARHATGTATDDAPEGTVWVPEMSTHVEREVALSMGLLNPTRARIDDRPLEQYRQDIASFEDDDTRELSDEDRYLLEAHQSLEDVDRYQENETEVNTGDNLQNAPSETVRLVAQELDAGDTSVLINAITEGNHEEAIQAFSEETGIEPQGAITLIESAVMDVSESAATYIGEDRWNAVVHAATGRDLMARRIVADVVTGKLKAEEMPKVYTAWYYATQGGDQ